ncbi:sporulation protein [Streptantibioticus rubrisoli]|uniref:Sporulation protein n=1 Tax=Streptantibioticus rubrisoli TaxID=1387313 RepID=A0ABT1PL03_9ACTN|nr:sporulation protein [Streptantibioticus rubrisoli]MCQ4046040.1 sporulation protein [Streptantibioticus rubrisoli]
MSREPNRKLAALMAEAGATNKGLAKRVREVAQRHGVHVGTTHVSVQRWLDGSGIQPETASFLAEALSEKLRRKVTAAALGFPGITAAAPSTGTTYATSLTEALGILDGLTQHRPEDGISAEPLIPQGEMDSAVLSWFLARPDGLVLDKPGARRVGMRDVSAIRAAGEAFMRLDFQFGGGHGHKALRVYFREEVLPLLNASFSAKVGAALYNAATEIAQLLAWTAYDTGDHALANRYMLSTLRLTQVTGDRMMGARILTNMSHQANYLRQASRAVRLARASVEGGNGHATPRAMALFSCHEARALSTARDHKGAAHAMNEAEKFFERAEGGDDPDWLSYMDEAELVGEFCHCFRDLKLGREAVHFAERAVTLTDPKYARTLGFCRMVLAQSQLLNGELEAAARTASQAVDGGDALQSARFQRYVADFQREISGHTGNPAVEQFNEQVRKAMARLDDE